MSGITVPVRPGGPQQLAGAPWTEGTTIYNPDPDGNGVWISSAGSVAPGNGMLIGGNGGTVSWDNKEGIPWACVDDGVTDPVYLFVSDDATNPQNPYAIALALFRTGIPFVLLTDVLVDAELLTSADLDMFVDVTQYASVIVLRAPDTDGILTASFAISDDFADGRLLGGDSCSSFSARRPVPCQMTVVGPWLRLRESDSTHVTVIGSNRTIPAKSLWGNVSAQGMVTYTPVFAPPDERTVLEGPIMGIDTPLPTGTCSLSFYVSDDTMIGYYKLKMMDQDGNINGLRLMETSQMNKQSGTLFARLTLSIPRAVYEVTFTMTGAPAGATDVLVDVMSTG